MWFKMKNKQYPPSKILLRTSAGRMGSFFSSHVHMGEKYYFKKGGQEINNINPVCANDSEKSFPFFPSSLPETQEHNICNGSRDATIRPATTEGQTEPKVNTLTVQPDLRHRMFSVPCPDDLCPECWAQNVAYHIASRFPCVHCGGQPVDVPDPPF